MRPCAKLLKILIGLSPLSLLAVHTPPPPPAGIIERQLEQEYDAKQVDPEKQIPLLEIDIPERQLDTGGMSVLISTIVFSGGGIFPQQELDALAGPYLNRELSMKEIGELCLAVQLKYSQRGYFLTRVYAPAQDIKEGALQINIIEGKLGTVTVVGNKHYSERFIRGHFKKYQGKAINYDQMLRALLLLDENMDLDVGAIFKKGKEFGTADVIIKVKDKTPVHLVVDTNNYGSLHTSKERTGARLDWGNLLRYGDQLTFIEVVGSPVKSLNFTDAIYRFPVNTYGSALEFSYLYAYFKTDKVSTGMKFKGKSRIGSAKFLQALHRTRRLNTDFFSSFDVKQIQNFSKGEEDSYDRLRVLTGGLSADYIDGLMGRNLLAGSVSWGVPDFLGASSVGNHMSSRQHSGGRFVHMNGSYKRLQSIPWDCFFLFNGVGQYSFDKLPLPEQFYIGGIDTVRGYKLAEGLGDQGFYTNIEFRVPLPGLRAHKLPWSKKRWGEFLHFVAFCDHGQTFSIGANKIVEGVEDRDGKHDRRYIRQHGRSILTSVGGGVRMYGPWKFEFSFDAGYPLTDKHRSSTTILYFRAAWNVL